MLELSRAEYIVFRSFDSMSAAHGSATPAQTELGEKRGPPGRRKPVALLPPAAGDCAWQVARRMTPRG